jgi:hypothetical protein
MVQQIMTQFSVAATVKEKVAVIIMVVFRLLKNNANNSSWNCRTLSIQCQRLLEAGLRGKKTVAKLRNIRGPVLRDAPYT